MASIRNIAKALGKRGGKARARRLSTDRKRAIASQGGKARAESLLTARRIQDNFRYLKAVQELAEKPPVVKRVKTCRGPLPGHYAKTH